MSYRLFTDCSFKTIVSPRMSLVPTPHDELLEYYLNLKKNLWQCKTNISEGTYRFSIYLPCCNRFMFWLQSCSIKHNLRDINTQTLSKVLRFGGKLFLGGRFVFIYAYNRFFWGQQNLGLGHCPLMPTPWLRACK